MSYPAGIVTREVNFGPAFRFENGEPLEMTVTITASRPLVWLATGSPAIPNEYVIDGAELETTHALPVTDQTGYGDGQGGAIDVSDGKQSHYYKGTVSYSRTVNGKKARVFRKSLPAFSLPADDLSPVDIDNLIPATTTGAASISIPDTWSAALAEAQATAQQAAAMLEEKGAAGGLAELDEAGLLPESRVPERLSEDGLAATFVAAPEHLFIENLPSPHFQAHRANPAVAPESTLTAWRLAQQGGADLIESDIWRLDDGTLVMMHDATVDRTTTSTGPITDYNGLTWSRLEIDTAGLLGGSGWPVERPPVWSQILNEFGNRVGLSLNPYGLQEIADIAAMIERLGVDKRTCSMVVGNESYAEYAVSLGFPVRVYHNYMADFDLPSCAARGFWGVSLTLETPTREWIDEAHSHGLKVGVFVNTNHGLAQRMIALGVDQISADDCTYVKNRDAIARTSDLFHIGAPTPGHYNLASPAAQFVAPNELSWPASGASTSVTRLGYMAPPDPDNFTVDYEVNIAASTNATVDGFSLLLLDDDYYVPGADPTNVSNGYVARMRADGQIQLRKVTAGSTSSLTGFTATTGSPVGVWVPMRVTVSPSGVTFTRVDTDESAVSTDTAFRGLRYLLGSRVGSGCNAKIRNVVYS